MLIRYVFRDLISKRGIDNVRFVFFEHFKIFLFLIKNLTFSL